MALKMHICTCTGKGKKCLHHVQLHCRKYSSLYTDTNLDTQNIHWYTKHPFIRISIRYSHYTSFYREHTATYNLHDQIKTWKIHDIQAYSLNKYNAGTAMIGNLWFCRLCFSMFVLLQDNFFLSLFQLINSNMQFIQCSTQNKLNIGAGEVGPEKKSHFRRKSLLI